MMKVLFIGAGLSDLRTGGIPLYVEELITSLMASGIKLMYLDPTGGRHQTKKGVFYETLTRKDGLEMIRFYNVRTIPDYGKGTLEPRYQFESETAFDRVLSQWLDTVEVDIVHVHECIGFPFSAFLEFKNRLIPLLMSLHDYYCLCPTVQLQLPCGEACNLPERDLQCAQCCASGLSTFEFQLSSYINNFRDRRGLSWFACVFWPRLLPLLRRFRKTFTPAADYKQRRSAGVQLLSSFDLLLANSKLTEKIYREIGGCQNIVHDQTFTRPSIRATVMPCPARTSVPPLRVLMLNVRRGPKGLFLIQQALEQLPADISGMVSIQAWGCSPIPHPSVENFPAYTSDQLDVLCANADVGLVPSVWRETYGFVGAEMLSRGLPLLAGNLGAMREYVTHGYDGLLFDTEDPSELAATLCTLVKDSDLLARLRTGAEKAWRKFPLFDDHVKSLCARYASLIGNKDRRTSK